MQYGVGDCVSDSLYMPHSTAVKRPLSVAYSCALTQASHRKGFHSDTCIVPEAIGMVLPGVFQFRAH